MFGPKAENGPEDFKHYDFGSCLGPGRKIAPEDQTIVILDHVWAQAGKWPQEARTDTI